ncbi:MAG TPA: OmpH family outer membrane protein [Chlorobaculum sp.]|jgi:outer membrane protein|nr:OmpH family outer membrane protein [Chlorobaculum sp.]
MSEFKGLKTISRSLLMALTVGMLYSAPIAFAADGSQKIGVVDYGKIFQQMPETKTAEQTMGAARNQTNTELGKMQSDLQNAVQTYLKQKQKTGKADAAKEKELQGKDESLRKLAAEKSNALAKKEQDLVAPIRQKIDGAVESIAKKDGYSMILDKNIRVYGDTQSDITFKVLDQLNIK